MTGAYQVLDNGVMFHERYPDIHGPPQRQIRKAGIPRGSKKRKESFLMDKTEDGMDGQMSDKNPPEIEIERKI